MGLEDLYWDSVDHNKSGDMVFRSGNGWVYNESYQNGYKAGLAAAAKWIREHDGFICYDTIMGWSEINIEATQELIAKEIEALTNED